MPSALTTPVGSADEAAASPWPHRPRLLAVARPLAVARHPLRRRQDEVPFPDGAPFVRVGSAEAAARHHQQHARPQRLRRAFPLRHAGVGADGAEPDAPLSAAHGRRGLEPAPVAKAAWPAPAGEGGACGNGCRRRRPQPGRCTPQPGPQRASAGAPRALSARLATGRSPSTNAKPHAVAPSSTGWRWHEPARPALPKTHAQPCSDQNGPPQAGLR